jgi:O-antigen/teichoic acid export membrane protein
VSPAAENGEAQPSRLDEDRPIGLTGRRLVRGSTWAFTSMLLPQAFTFLTGIAIARILGVGDVGRVALIAFVSSTLATLLILGLPQATVRFVGEELGAGRPARVRGLMGLFWRFLPLPALAGFVALAAVGALGGEPSAAWVLAGVTCGGAVLHSLPAAFLVGAQRWPIVLPCACSRPQSRPAS